MDVLCAVPNTQASYTWKSICSALEVVKRGIRWRVGNGTNIDLWHDGWIPRDSCFTPITPNLRQMCNLQVNSIINSESRTWNEDFVRELL